MKPRRLRFDPALVDRFLDHRMIHADLRQDAIGAAINP
jgi:hypothetical protein